MASLNYFPEIYPNEALYSILARYHRHTGNLSINRCNKELFGKSAVRATFDLPNYMHLLVEHFCWDRALTVEQLAFCHTHINYYTAFLPAPLAEKCRAIQAHGLPNLHLMLGLNSSVVRRKEQLSFCDTCCEEMLQLKGEMWWRVDHQLPGVVVCRDHGTLLRESEVSLWSAGAHGFLAATPERCQPTARSLIEDPSPKVRALCLEIAQRSAGLLDTLPNFADFEAITECYRTKLWNKGVMRSKKQVAVKEFTAFFEEMMGEVLDALSVVFARNTSSRAWIMEMARKHKNIKHPLQHIIFQMFLDNLPERVAPFGPEPWPCMNRVAHLTGSAGANVTVDEKAVANGITGTFRCTCGYAYTMTVYDDGRLAGPRFKEFGPLLDPTLTDLVKRGISLRGAAKTLALHPRAVAQAAERLRLNTGWKAEPRKGPRLGRAVLPPPKSRSKGPGTRAGRPSSARINWCDQDARLLEAVRVHGEAVRMMDPPVRVTRIEIERRIRGPNYLTLRAYKLPASLKLATELSESTEAFRQRRLSVAIDKHIRAGLPMVPSRILKAAGLPGSWMIRVRAAIVATQEIS